MWTADELKVILQKDFVEDERLFEHGRCNDDAVDMSIICWCLGEDIDELIDKIAIDNKWTPEKYKNALGHLERVEPYLPKWGEYGKMDAMVYCINY